MSAETTTREAQLLSGIQHIQLTLDTALRDLQLDSVLSRFASDDIPDAVARLDHVVRMTEEAAHKTLDLVETARGLVNSWLKMPMEVHRAAEMRQLAQLLSEVALAQGYQDLTGQIIRRVVGMVHAVETALHALLKAAGTQPIKTERAWDGKPEGPGVLVRDKAVSQNDADDLLADLGL